MRAVVALGVVAMSITVSALAAADEGAPKRPAFGDRGQIVLASGFGVPVHGTTLYNAAAFTFGRNNASTDLYADVDATAAFDVTVK